MTGVAPADDGGRGLRQALGRYATGVAVVTARPPGGRAVGMTVNSFTSVSLSPPLVLWCIADAAPSRPEFAAASHVAVHILAAGQHHLASRFAGRPAGRHDKVGRHDKFDGLATSAGLGGAPLIDGAIARFQCRTVRFVDTGDHSIVVGEVNRFEAFDGEPLLFHGGTYRVAAAHPDLNR